MSIYKDNQYSLVTAHNLESWKATNNSTWNSILFSKIINQFDNLDFSFCELEENVNIDLSNNLTGFKEKGLIKRMIKYYENLSKYIYKESDAFIYNTYLSKLDQIKLQISFCQLPKRRDVVYPNFFQIDQKLRGKFDINNNEGDRLEKLARKLLIQMIPTLLSRGICRNK